MGSRFDPKWPNRNYAIGPMRATIKSTVVAAEKRFMHTEFLGWIRFRGFLMKNRWTVPLYGLSYQFILHMCLPPNRLYGSICNEQCMISILTIINSFDYSFAWEKVWYIRKPSLGLDWMKLKDSVLSHEYQMRANRAGPGGRSQTIRTRERFQNPENLNKGMIS